MKGGRGEVTAGGQEEGGLGAVGSRGATPQAVSAPPSSLPPLSRLPPESSSSPAPLVLRNLCHHRGPLLLCSPLPCLLLSCHPSLDPGMPALEVCPRACPAETRPGAAWWPGTWPWPERALRRGAGVAQRQAAPTPALLSHPDATGCGPAPSTSPRGLSRSRYLPLPACPPPTPEGHLNHRPSEAHASTCLFPKTTMPFVSHLRPPEVTRPGPGLAGVGRP